MYNMYKCIEYALNCTIFNASMLVNCVYIESEAVEWGVNMELTTSLDGSAS